MKDKIKDFNAAHKEKLNLLNKEERAKAGLKKLVQEMEVSNIKEPDGLVSGATDENGEMIINLEEDFDDKK